jgi:hypothetical protein
MFVSEEIEDIIDEIICKPENWAWDQHQFWHKKKKMNFWTCNGWMFSFTDNAGGMEMNIFERYSLYKAIQETKRFINSL